MPIQSISTFGGCGDVFIYMYIFMYHTYIYIYVAYVYIYIISIHIHLEPLFLIGKVPVSSKLQSLPIPNA